MTTPSPSPLHLLPFTYGREILRVQTGSRSTLALTTQDGADDDQMGIFIPHPRHLLSLPTTDYDDYTYRSTNNAPHTPDTRSTPQTTDLTVYSLRKFVHLAAQGNPNLISTLFAPPHQMLLTSPTGQALLHLTPAILSKQAASKFLGYLSSQRQGLTNPSGRHTNRPELIQKHGYDTKFAYHLLRLGFQGVQLLTEHTITLPIPPAPREFLIAVRQGKIPLDNVLQLADTLTNNLSTLKIQSTLPEYPDYPAIDSFLIKAHLTAWEGKP